MRNYRTLGDLEEGYLHDHPDEVDEYLTILFDEYAQSGDTAALLSSLRIISRVKGLQKVLSEDSNLEFAQVNALLHAMGYRLAPLKFDPSICDSQLPKFISEQLRIPDAESPFREVLS